MSKISASGLATGIAIAMLIGMGFAGRAEESVAQQRAALPVELSAKIPEGRCQIQYDSLPETHQPAHMECEHANWLARTWGGRVMEQNADGLHQIASYDGANDFTGVPIDALPRAGRCRAWIDSAPAHAQPAESDCRTARRIVAAEGGRVLFMPL